MKSNPNRYARAALGAGMLAVAALLAGCGGSGDQEETFAAKRVLAFGDEFSVINPDGSKYTVNGLAANSTTQIDCQANPLWIQLLASSYGVLFAECPGTGTTVPTGRIYAANQATVADLAAQIDTHIASGGGFVAGDLSTVLVGANDVVQAYQQSPGVGEGQLLADMTARGTALASQVNRLAGLGTRVLIVTIPDMGLTPYAGTRTPGTTNPNVVLLSRLSTAFNDALLANILNDGRKIGLVQLDEYLKAVDTASINKYNGSTYANSIAPACAVALPNCTANTLVTGAQTAVWLWADDRHFGANAQSVLGSLASSRAANNPF